MAAFWDRFVPLPPNLVVLALLRRYSIQRLLILPLPESLIHLIEELH